jgi:hypothetical protein
MQARAGGNIITISSIAAVRGGSHYGATKRAIESMTVGLANEVKEQGGIRFGREGVRPMGTLAPPDSYVEAAVLLAMQTPATCTGACYSDAEAIQALAGDAEYEKYKAMNPPFWSEPTVRAYQESR